MRGAGMRLPPIEDAIAFARVRDRSRPPPLVDVPIR
jgi:hypothetical protein